jgi:hypothetical protein
MCFYLSNKYNIWANSFLNWMLLAFLMQCFVGLDYLMHTVTSSSPQCMFNSVIGLWALHWRVMYTCLMQSIGRIFKNKACCWKFIMLIYLSYVKSVAKMTKAVSISSVKNIALWWHVTVLRHGSLCLYSAVTVLEVCRISVYMEL